MDQTVETPGEIILKRGRSAAIQRRHPWIFSGAIFRKKHCASGSRVKVFDEHGQHLCTGHYHDGSIAVRLLQFGDGALDQDYWNRRFQSALALRRSLNLIRKDNNAYRLIHGEGDGLPGLIVDVYAHVAVVQCHTVAMYKERPFIEKALKEVLPDLNTIYQKSPNAGEVKNIAEDGFWLGDQEQTEILENGHRFIIDIGQGQKTGFFLDQRDNRALMTEFAQGKVVHNLFSYSGGFSVYALKAGAQKVVSVDISEKAIDLANRNVALNGGGPHEGIAADVMSYLKEIPDHSQDIMVVDPPAFAKSRKRSHNAVQAYKRLNAMALKKIKPGGLLFTFSCSQVIGPQLFQDTIRSAAIEAGRPARIIRQLTQGGDHPINIFHPEGHYLKGLVLEV